MSEEPSLPAERTAWFASPIPGQGAPGPAGLPGGPHIYAQRMALQQRDDLVVNNLKLVRHVVGRLVAKLPPGVDLENLEAAGALGLVEAANRFDPTRGIAFDAYAYRRIRGAVLDELRRNCPLPQKLLEKVAKVRRAVRDLTPPVQPEQIAAACRMSVDEVGECLEAMRMTRMVSFDEEPNQGRIRFRFDSESPGSEAEAAEMRGLLRKAILKLGERERLVVTLYYLENLRLKEIGPVLGLSESRVSRVLAESLYQLSEMLRSFQTEP
ncbi:MAG: sigma-70 family RNA polymerase sigma factor [Gemmataceae bacterium]|nr:sigma-70 family RNA polymerase sigma factor [Gemmataceae bacterium]